MNLILTVIMFATLKIAFDIKIAAIVSSIVFSLVIGFAALQSVIKILKEREDW